MPHLFRWWFLEDPTTEELAVIVVLRDPSGEFLVHAIFDQGDLHSIICIVARDRALDVFLQRSGGVRLPRRSTTGTLSFTGALARALLEAITITEALNHARPLLSPVVPAVVVGDCGRALLCTRHRGIPRAFLVRGRDGIAAAAAEAFTQWPDTRCHADLVAGMIRRLDIEVNYPNGGRVAFPAAIARAFVPGVLYRAHTQSPRAASC